MNKRIASYLNRAGDIEVVVTLLASGNVVASGECVVASGRSLFTRHSPLATGSHYKTEDAARAYALTCAAGDDDEELPL